MEEKQERILLLSEGVKMTVSESILSHFLALQPLGDYNGEISLLDISESQMLFIIDYYTQLEEKGSKKRDGHLVDEWEQKLARELTNPKLFSLLLLLHKYEVKVLRDMLCKYVATLLKSMSPDEIRARFRDTY